MIEEPRESSARKRGSISVRGQRLWASRPNDLRGDVEALMLRIGIVHDWLHESGVLEDMRLLEQFDECRCRLGRSAELNLVACELPFRQPSSIRQYSGSFPE